MNDHALQQWTCSIVGFYGQYSDGGGDDCDHYDDGAGDDGRHTTAPGDSISDTVALLASVCKIVQVRANIT